MWPDARIKNRFSTEVAAYLISRKEQGPRFEAQYQDSLRDDLERILKLEKALHQHEKQLVQATEEDLESFMDGVEKRTSKETALEYAETINDLYNRLIAAAIIPQSPINQRPPTSKQSQATATQAKAHEQGHFGHVVQHRGSDTASMTEEERELETHEEDEFDDIEIMQDHYNIPREQKYLSMRWRFALAGLASLTLASVAIGAYQVQDISELRQEMNAGKASVAEIESQLADVDQKQHQHGVIMTKEHAKQRRALRTIKSDLQEQVRQQINRTNKQVSQQLADMEKKVAAVPQVKMFGCILGDCINGTGTYIYKNLNKYTGKWQDGKRHGRGSFYYIDGEQYSGNWQEDRRHGEGSYTYISGNRYVGSWANGSKEGSGSVHFNDGRITHSLWSNDKRLN